MSNPMDDSRAVEVLKDLWIRAGHEDIDDAIKVAIAALQEMPVLRAKARICDARKANDAMNAKPAHRVSDHEFTSTRNEVEESERALAALAFVSTEERGKLSAPPSAVERGE